MKLAKYSFGIGDRFGHLLLMRVLAVIGCGVVASFIYVDTYWVMMISVTMAGATLASISPISLALQGVIVDPPDYKRSNARDIQVFQNRLRKLGIVSTTRKTRGDDIDAACGQLAGKVRDRIRSRLGSKGKVTA